MDFKTELSKWGYSKGNSIDVEILANEVLPYLFSQQERMYSEEDLKDAYFSFPDEWICFEEWFEQFKKK